MSRRRLGGLIVLMVGALALGVGGPYLLQGTSPAPEPLVVRDAPEAPPRLEDMMNRAIEAAKAQDTGQRTCNPPRTVPGQPPGEVVNLHCRVGPGPDYFADAKAMGMSDEEARAYAARAEAAIQEMFDRVLSTLPPPPAR